MTTHISETVSRVAATVYLLVASALVAWPVVAVAEFVRISFRS